MQRQKAGQSAATAWLPGVDVGTVPVVGALPFARSMPIPTEKLLIDSADSMQDRHVEALPAYGLQGTALVVGSAGDQRNRGMGSFVGDEKVPQSPTTTPSVQKIRALRAVEHAAITEVCANDCAHD
jgi:hypothetical protein